MKNSRCGEELSASAVLLISIFFVSFYLQDKIRNVAIFSK
jgi:hypothetical protein